MAKDNLVYRELQEQATALKHYHPEWSFSQFGRKIGCSPSFVSRWVTRDQAGLALDDQPRSGRPPKADAAAQQHIVMAAQLPECRTAAAIAAKGSAGINNSKRHYVGLGGAEYSEVLSQLFEPEGNRLFQGAGQYADKGQLQLDNAKPTRLLQTWHTFQPMSPRGLASAFT